MTHGVRRAAEMREVALTVDLLGLDGAMSRASVGWQQRIGELGLRASPEERPGLSSASPTGSWPACEPKDL